MIFEFIFLLQSIQYNVEGMQHFLVETKDDKNATKSPEQVCEWGWVGLKPHNNEYVLITDLQI